MREGLPIACKAAPALGITGCYWYCNASCNVISTAHARCWVKRYQFWRVPGLLRWRRLLTAWARSMQVELHQHRHQ